MPSSITDGKNTIGLTGDIGGDTGIGLVVLTSISYDPRILFIFGAILTGPGCKQGSI
jgi:hypothetical protein